MSESFGIIAGGGMYPLLMAESARKNGVKKLVCVAFDGETDKAIESQATETVWLRVGQLGKVISTFTSRQIHEVAMVGKIGLTNLFDLRPDIRALKTIATLKERNAESLFGAVARELEKDGVKVVPASRYLEHLLPAAGHIAGPKLSSRQREDVEWGGRIAKTISAMNIGQTIVVRNGTVLAVEAYESTSDTIARGGKAGREKAIAIKVSKPRHDMRFDIPVIGLQTLEVARTAGLSAIVFEAGKTMLLEMDAMCSFATEHGITLEAVDFPAPAHPPLT